MLARLGEDSLRVDPLYETTALVLIRHLESQAPNLTGPTFLIHRNCEIISVYGLKSLSLGEMK